MQHKGNKQFGTLELSVNTQRLREQFNKNKVCFVVIMKELNFFLLLPFLLGNAIVIMRKICSSSSLGRLLFEEISHRQIGTLETRAVQSFNAVEVSQMQLPLAQRIGGHDRTRRGTRRRAVVAHRACSIPKEKKKKRISVEFVGTRAHKDRNGKKKNFKKLRKNFNKIRGMVADKKACAKRTTEKKNRRRQKEKKIKDVRRMCEIKHRRRNKYNKVFREKS